MDREASARGLTEMICQNCGKDLPDQAQFCPACGYSVSELTASPSPPPPPPPPPPGYAPPYQPASGYWPSPPVVSRTTNGFAVASLVLGILWIWGLGSLLALIFGLVARRQIDDSGGVQAGRGLAIAGIVLGVIGIVGAILVIIAIASSVHNNPGY